MAKQQNKKADEAAIVRGSGNVFADLGFADAEERQTKLALAHALNTIIDARRMTQAAAAEALGLSQPKVSALRNYKLEGFSALRLMTLLNALVEMVTEDIEDYYLARRHLTRGGQRVTLESLERENERD